MTKWCQSFKFNTNTSSHPPIFMLILFFKPESHWYVGPVKATLFVLIFPFLPKTEKLQNIIIYIIGNKRNLIFWVCYLHTLRFFPTNIQCNRFIKNPMKSFKSVWLLTRDWFRLVFGFGNKGINFTTWTCSFLNTTILDQIIAVVKFIRFWK